MRKNTTLWTEIHNEIYCNKYCSISEMNVSLNLFPKKKKCFCRHSHLHQNCSNKTLRCTAEKAGVQRIVYEDIKSVNRVEWDGERERIVVWKRFFFLLSTLPATSSSAHGASFWTIQHWAFIVPLKWSTFRSPTYVCSFKITMAAVWMEGMIHLLRHSVTVNRNQKTPRTRSLWKVAQTCEVSIFFFLLFCIQ